MHTYNSTIDPLDKEIDFTHMKIEKAPYKFDLKEKISTWLDTLYDGANISKDEFYVEVESALRTFCNIKKNPYSEKFSSADRLKMFLDAFIKENHWTKQETKEKIDAILS